MAEEMRSRLNLAMLEDRSAETVFGGLAEWMSAFVDGPGPLQARTHEAVCRAVGSFDDVELRRAHSALRNTGSDFGFWPADGVARAVLRAFMGPLVEGFSVNGVDHLVAAQEAGPVLILCNHLAYCDMQVKDWLMVEAGHPELADRLVALAGPKVYETLFRRLAALGIGTIKTAQSSNLAHNASTLSPRDVAAVALESVRIAHEIMGNGGLVVLYAEGARSRSGRLNSFLKAARRYAELDALRIVPMALSGSQSMMPIGALTMRPGNLRLDIGQAIEVDSRRPTDAMAKAWHSISRMAGPEQRPLHHTKPIV